MIMHGFFFDDDVVNSSDASTTTGADSATYPQHPGAITSVIPIEAVLANLNCRFTIT